MMAGEDIDLTALAEPVRRYFRHALGPRVAASSGTRLRMTGRIKAGVWLPFRATWDGDARSLLWDATVAVGPLKVLRATDRFAAGVGSMDVRLGGRLRVVHAQDDDTARSAAGRAAVEAIWTPASLLPDRGVDWRADGDTAIVASWDVPPERPEVRIEIDADGAVRSACVMRWDGDAYIPCGAEVHDERDFGGLVIPSRVTAGWWFGTPRYAPFFEATILDARGR